MVRIKENKSRMSIICSNLSLCTKFPYRVFYDVKIGCITNLDPYKNNTLQMTLKIIKDDIVINVTNDGNNHEISNSIISPNQNPNENNMEPSTTQISIHYPEMKYCAFIDSHFPGSVAAALDENENSDKKKMYWEQHQVLLS